MPGPKSSCTISSTSSFASAWKRFICFWLHLCCLVLPISAQLDHVAPNLSHWHVQPNSGLKGNFTPEFVGSSPAVIPFQKLSWTEEFLQHMRALSTAAEFADPDIAATDTVDKISSFWPAIREIDFGASSDLIHKIFGAHCFLICMSPRR